MPDALRGQLAFGERIYNGRVVPHLAEQKVVLELQRLRGEGLSYGKLVKWLKAQGTKTKNGAPWSRAAVYKILERAKKVVTA